MKDKTSIFKHSGAGTGFYGGHDRAGDHGRMHVCEYCPPYQRPSHGDGPQSHGGDGSPPLRGRGNVHDGY